MSAREESPENTKGLASKLGFWIGLACAFGLQLFPPPEGLSVEGWRVASLGALMAIWWATEAIPLPATGLLPLIVLPLVTDLSLKSQIAPPYASSIILLLMGGFIMAKGVEKWGLHERIALNIVARVGDHPRMLIAGFMLATALLSMWISNTATTLMMLPIALSAAAAAGDEDGGLARALVLGLAYAASIGGVATPVGTPTNLIALEALEASGAQSISFTNWMMFGIPAVVLLLPVAWAVVSFSKGVDVEHSEDAHHSLITRLKALGKMSSPEFRVACVFGLIAFLWIFRQPLQSLPGLGALSDTGIAIFGAVLMMLVPASKGSGGRLLSWEDAERIPWGMLLLFGGGLSLAAGIRGTGLSVWIGEQLAFVHSAPDWVIVLVVVALVIFLTELTSNVATTTTLMPILAILAVSADLPFAALAAPAAVAASCAFMLPVATAPNAIVYSTGRVSIAEMMRAGVRINLVGIVILTAIGAWLAPMVLGQ